MKRFENQNRREDANAQGPLSRRFQPPNRANQPNVHDAYLRLYGIKFGSAMAADAHSSTGREIVVEAPNI